MWLQAAVTPVDGVDHMGEQPKCDQTEDIEDHDCAQRVSTIHKKGCDDDKEQNWQYPAIRQTPQGMPMAIAKELFVIIIDIDENQREEDNISTAFSAFYTEQFANGLKG